VRPHTLPGLEDHGLAAQLVSRDQRSAIMLISEARRDRSTAIELRACVSGIVALPSDQAYADACRAGNSETSSPVATAVSEQPAITPHPDVPALYPVPLPSLFVRRLGQDDRAALAAHLISLSGDDRRNRFGGSSDDATIRRHCDGLDLEDTVCFAALDAYDDVIGEVAGFVETLFRFR